MASEPPYELADGHGRITRVRVRGDLVVLDVPPMTELDEQQQEEFGRLFVAAVWDAKASREQQQLAELAAQAVSE